MKGIKIAGFILLSVNLFAVIFSVITGSQPILSIILAIIFFVQFLLIVRFQCLIYQPVRWLESSLEQIDRGKARWMNLKKNL